MHQGQSKKEKKVVIFQFSYPLSFIFGILASYTQDVVWSGILIVKSKKPSMVPDVVNPNK